MALAAVYGGLLGVREPMAAAPAAMVALFFALAVFASGFGVADTHVLFGLAPAEAPARLLVVADVTTSVAKGLAPVMAGILLDVALAGGAVPTRAYGVLFGGAALAQLAALLPLRGFRARSG